MTWWHRKPRQCDYEAETRGATWPCTALRGHTGAHCNFMARIAWVPDVAARLVPYEDAGSKPPPSRRYPDRENGQP